MQILHITKSVAFFEMYNMCHMQIPPIYHILRLTSWEVIFEPCRTLFQHCKLAKFESSPLLLPLVILDRNESCLRSTNVHEFTRTLSFFCLILRNLYAPNVRLWLIAIYNREPMAWLEPANDDTMVDDHRPDHSGMLGAGWREGYLFNAS